MWLVGVGGQAAGETSQALGTPDIQASSWAWVYDRMEEDKS